MEDDEDMGDYDEEEGEDSDYQPVASSSAARNRAQPSRVRFLFCRVSVLF